MSTTNGNHMMYSCWDTEHERQSFLSFWSIFCPFTPPKNLKNQNFEKMKEKTGDIIILHKCTKNHDHIACRFWDMAHDRCNCYFSFWAIFCPFTPAWKMKISKEWKKKPGDIIILHKCTKTHDHMLYCSWDMTCDGCNSYFSFWASFFFFFALLPP